MPPQHLVCNSKALSTDRAWRISLASYERTEKCGNEGSTSHGSCRLLHRSIYGTQKYLVKTPPEATTAIPHLFCEIHLTYCIINIFTLMSLRMIEIARDRVILISKIYLNTLISQFMAWNVTTIISCSLFIPIAALTHSCMSII